MNNSRICILKLLQGALSTDGKTFTLERTYIEDIYELLTEPYQIEIDDIAPMEIEYEI